MPRGTTKTTEEKLKIIEQEITEMEERKAKIQSKISDLNSQRKELQSMIDQKKLIELSNIIEQSGKSPEEILAMLKQD